MQVEKYQLENGTVPFDEWVNGLAPVFRARVYANLVKIELGNFCNVKPIEGKDAEDLFEQRMFFGPGFRTYFGKDNGTLVVLLCGGDKKTQKKDIAKAKQLWKEYKSRKGG